MEIISLASSSTGNSYLISDGKTKLLIECGIPWKDIQRKLNFKTPDIAGCLISHAHGDHCKAAKDVIKAGINIYTSQETITALQLKGHRVKKVKSAEQFEVNTFTILPFELQHDVTNYGYLLYSNFSSKKLVFLTDTYYCKYRFAGLNYIMVECNYSKQILDKNVEAGFLNNMIRNRIIRSHFGLDNVKDFLKANDLSQVELIMLMHLSNGNSDAKQFKSEIEKLTGVPVRIC